MFSVIENGKLGISLKKILRKGELISVNPKNVISGVELRGGFRGGYWHCRCWKIFNSSTDRKYLRLVTLVAVPNFFHINLKYTFCKCLFSTGHKVFGADVCFGTFPHNVRGQALSWPGNAGVVQVCPRTSASRPSRPPLCSCLMRTGRSYRPFFISWAMSQQL